MEAPWTPPTSINVLFAKLRDAIAYAEDEHRLQAKLYVPMLKTIATKIEKKIQNRYRHSQLPNYLYFSLYSLLFLYSFNLQKVGKTVRACFL